MLSYLMCVTMVYFKHKEVDMNSLLVICAVSVLGGQGAILILLACLQAMLDYHTVICSVIVNGILISYFIGADSLGQSLRKGLFAGFEPNTTVLNFGFVNIIMFILTAIYINEEPDKDQLEGKAISLSKGIMLKKKLLIFVLCLSAYLGALMVVLFNPNFK